MTYPRSFLLLLLLLVAASSAHAQSVLTWNGTGGPCGFTTLHLILLQEEMLAVSLKKIYASSDGGRNWSYRGGIDVPGFIAYGYAIAPSGEFFLGGHGNQTGSVLYRSADRGRTWQPLSLPGRSGAAVTVTPNGTIIAGGPNNSIYRSSNNGTTWDETPVRHVLGSAIRTFPDGSIFLAGTIGTGRGIYRSSDDGVSWTAVYPLDSTRLVSAITTTGESTVDAAMYSTTIAGIIMTRSSDRGENWVEEEMPSDVEQVSTLLAVPSQATLYVGTNRGQVLRRNYTTARWEQVASSNPLQSDYVYTLAFDTTSQQLIAGIEIGPFRLTYSDGVEFWTQSCGGVFDTPTTNIAFSPPSGDMIATTGTGIYRSSNNGEIWQLVTYGRYSITGVAESSEGALVFGTVLGGLRRIMPAEDTARRIDENFSVVNVSAVAITTADEIIAGTTRGTMYTSTTRGATWDSIPGTGSTTGSIRAIVPSGSEVYIAAASGLFKRLPGSSTLMQIPVGRGAQSFSTLSIAPGGYMAVAGGDQAWISRNAGVSWTKLPAPGANRIFTSIVVNRDGKVYAVAKQTTAPRYGRIYFTTETEAGWKDADLGTGNDSLAAFALALDPNGTLYATSATQVFRASIPLSVPSDRHPLVFPLTLGITPMPASAEVTIRFALGSAGEAMLSLSDQNGREIMQQNLGVRLAGEQTVVIDVGNLPPGLYPCEIRSGRQRAAAVVRVVR